MLLRGVRKAYIYVGRARGIDADESPRIMQCYEMVDTTFSMVDTTFLWLRGLVNYRFYQPSILVSTIVFLVSTMVFWYQPLFFWYQPLFFGINHWFFGINHCFSGINHGFFGISHWFFGINHCFFGINQIFWHKPPSSAYVFLFKMHTFQPQPRKWYEKLTLNPKICIELDRCPPNWHPT